MTTWLHDQMTTWLLHNYMTTWLHDHTTTWPHDHMTTWPHDHMTTWIHDYMIIWLHDYMTTWPHDYMTTHDSMITWNCNLFICMWEFLFQYSSTEMICLKRSGHIGPILRITTITTWLHGITIFLYILDICNYVFYIVQSRWPESGDLVSPTQHTELSRRHRHGRGGTIPLCQSEEKQKIWVWQSHCNHCIYRGFQSHSLTFTKWFGLFLVILFFVLIILVSWRFPK